MSDKATETRSRTRAAIEEMEATGKSNAEQERRQASIEKGLRTKRINKFVAETLPVVLEELDERIESVSDRGEYEATKEWHVFGETHQESFEEDLDKHKKLAECALTHFIDEGYEGKAYSRRAQTRDYSIPISDGYSPDCPPMMDAGYTEVGLVVSWVEQTEQTD